MQVLFGYDLFLLGDLNILPKRELHSSLWVSPYRQLCAGGP